VTHTYSVSRCHAVTRGLRSKANPHAAVTRADDIGGHVHRGGLAGGQMPGLPWHRPAARGDLSVHRQSVPELPRSRLDVAEPGRPTRPVSRRPVHRAMTRAGCSEIGANQPEMIFLEGGKPVFWPFRGRNHPCLSTVYRAPRTAHLPRSMSLYRRNPYRMGITCTSLSRRLLFDTAGKLLILLKNFCQIKFQYELNCGDATAPGGYLWS
jgi:hypothetical protein